MATLGQVIDGSLPDLYRSCQSEFYVVHLFSLCSYVMAMGMFEFLRNVDDPPQGDAFIERVVKLLAGEGLELNDVVDLDGLSNETLTNSLPGGSSAALVFRSFPVRARKLRRNPRCLKCHQRQRALPVLQRHWELAKVVMRMFSNSLQRKRPQRRSTL